MAYKLTRGKTVIRLADNACVPEAEENPDWRKYQEWLAAGNAPLPADPEPAPIDLGDIENLPRTLKALALAIAQITGTPAATLRQIFKEKYQQLGGN